MKLFSLGLILKGYFVKADFDLVPLGFNLRGDNDFGFISFDRVGLLVLQMDLLLRPGDKIRAEFEVSLYFFDVIVGV